MDDRRTLVGLGLLALLVGVASPAAPAELVRPTRVAKVFGDGRHNMCPSLERWKDAYWLAFRNGTNHRSPDGNLIVLKSSDGDSWQKVAQFDEGPDDRDPQWLATKDRLFLFDPVFNADKTGRTVVKSTDDGRRWSPAKQVYTSQYVLWRPVEFDGRFYAAAYKWGTPAAQRHADLITSTDGEGWTAVSTIRAGQGESEPTVHFFLDGSAIVFLRDVSLDQGVVLTSERPYRQWSKGVEKPYMAGTSAYTFRGVHYFMSRTVKKNGQGGLDSSTTIFTFDAAGNLTPYCVLPASGDCAYATAVEVGSEMLVAYYSSHEGPTSIYLARVPLTKKP